jgi:biopolymer transport protein TolR
MSLGKRDRKRPMAEINVVPYIDVMLVLLVIFMVTTPLLSQGVKVDLPQASAQPLPPKDKEPIIVSVDAQGIYYLNIAQNPAQAIDAATLVNQVSAQLRADAQQNQQQPVLVKGDKNVNYGSVMQAMVLLQQAGAPSVGLITQPPDTTTPNTQG